MLFKGRKKHVNEVSRSGKRESRPRNSRITMTFHVVHHQQEPRRCVFFLMSMQHFVRMIPTHSQPVLKKAPPSTGRPMPAGFKAAQAPGLNLPLAATPMTPSHPPRPPIEALPKYASMETSPSANKHPLEQPAQQGPPNKHVRPKAFPYGQLPPSQTSMASPSAGEYA